MPKWNSFDAFLNDALKAPTDTLRQQMVNDLLAERPQWPWVEATQATFIFSKLGVQQVALNMDIIKGDPPFAAMQNLAGTTLWFVTQTFEKDDLLDYLLAVDDPMTPLATERDIVGRVARHWRKDPLNPLGIHTAQVDVSVLRMEAARPFPDWQAMANVPRGQVYEHTISSAQMGFTERKLWIYTPPGYDDSGLIYPMLILEDGQWAVGPLQVPYIADTLIKHGRLRPVVIAMRQSGDQTERIQNMVSNDRHYGHLMTELLPFIQTHYRVDSTNLGIGGMAVSAIGAAYAALQNPAVFNGLMMISPPLGKGAAQEKLREYPERFQMAKMLPRRIFQSVGRYESPARFYKPALGLRDILAKRPKVFYNFAEVGSGHGLVGFKSVLPEALSWVFPGEALVG